MFELDDIEWLRFRVAQKLGWKEVEYSRDGYLVGHGPGRKDIKVVPSYALNIEAAWEIVNALLTQGAYVKITNTLRRIKEYDVEIHWPGYAPHHAVHERVSIAICRAFLNAEVPCAPAA